MPDPQLGQAEFRKRFLGQFRGPAFAPLRAEMDRVAGAAWEEYREGRKAPETAKAGPGFADPDYELSLDWVRARDAIGKAQRRHDDPNGPTRLLLINGAGRSEHTCPGEMSKSWRLVEIARQALAGMQAVEVEILDLSRLASEYGRRIHPCKTCFSTAPALCHWPCSCYPNYSLGQTQDWMNEIYPMWVAAHGIMIVTPVNWYHASSGLKLMIDRLVCADGGSADPTLTHGKDARRAKELEPGWGYPQHLKGRLFAIVVHGDAEGARGVRNALSDWLTSMGLRSAGPTAELERYIGYWAPYATSHRALDRDLALQDEVRNAARTLLEATEASRKGRLVNAGADLEAPRRK
jgi:multimeric flavodoxin WrbA